MRTFAKLLAVLAAVCAAFLVGIGFANDVPTVASKIDPFGAGSDSAVFRQAQHLIARDYYRPISDAEIQNTAIKGVVASLGDRFSSYMTPREYALFKTHQNPHFSGIGLDVKFTADGLLVLRTYPNTPARKAGILAGETVISADGKPFKGRAGDAAVALIQGRPGTPVTVQVRAKDGKVRTLTVKRQRILVPATESKLVTAPDGTKVGVVALSGFVEGAGAQVSQAVKRLLAQGAKGIVLDLRGNGGGLLDEAVSVASVFIANGTIVVTKGRNRPKQVYRAAGGAIPVGVPVAVVVDGGTASASEIVAGAIQDRRRGVVVGSHTFGKGVFQEVTELSNGGALDITVGEYFTPSGRNLGGGGVKQGGGIKPNVPVPAGSGSAAALAAAVAAASGQAR